MLSQVRCDPENRRRGCARLTAEAEASKGGARPGALHLHEHMLERCQRKGRGAQGNDEASSVLREGVRGSAEEPMRVVISAARLVVVVLC